METAVTDEETIQEKDLCYPLPLSVAMFDGAGTFYPSGYQKLATQIVEKHLDAIHLGVPTLMKNYGVAWVILEMSFQVCRPITEQDKVLYTRTWHTSRKGPLFRRDMEFRDESGALVGQCCVYTTMLDLKKRRICTDRSVLGLVKLPDGEEMLQASSKFHEAPDFTEVEQRLARYSWQDGLGHVNNCRYGEFAYDAMTAEERVRLKELRRLDVWFQGEMRPGVQFSVQKAAENDCIYVKGVLLPEEKPSFVIKMNF